MGNSRVEETETTPNWDKVLEGLTSDKIYKYFNENKNTGSNYDDVCEIKKEWKTPCSEFKEICNKFAKNLEGIFCKEHKENTINYCIFLKYWAYEQIKKKCKKNKTDIELSPLTDKLKNLQYSIKKVCPEKFECYDYYSDYMDGWEEEKLLYEYFLNFDEIYNYINTKNDYEKYKKYVEHILGLYEKKISKGCCKIKYYHLCDHYFRCDPKYHPKLLLSNLEEPKGNPTPSESDIHGIDISAEIDEKKKYLDEDGVYIIPTRTDFVIPDLQDGWHKRKDKSKSRIQNVRCIMNYAAKNSDYALVSCYNFEKGYPDVEHIFRPTKKEEDFYSKLKEKENKPRNSMSSSSDYTNSSPKGLNKNEKVATKTNITAVLPESIQGYSPLGELINKKKDEYAGEYQPSRREAYVFAPTARNYDIGGEESGRVPCTYIKINEDKTKECVKKENLNEIKVFTDPKAQNLSAVGDVAMSSATDSYTDEYLDDFETIGHSMFKTPMFRGATLAALLAGIVFVFFIYFKFTPFGSWFGRKNSKKENMYMEMPIEYEQNVQSEYYEAPQRRDNVRDRPTRDPSPSRSPRQRSSSRSRSSPSQRPSQSPRSSPGPSPGPSPSQSQRPSSNSRSRSSSSRQKDPPKERIRIAYHAS
ncbi:PIR protein [Plasmodium vivax]|uniref:PIR protein n=1 Tax=Plasmodium vivax TaxID=5855 RepID=A0A564ZSM4_PLAVI|nr:PIR protein [Plasmodium vivax]